jgi:hypothetical protein
LGVSEASVIERLMYAAVAVALVSSVAISTDDSMYRLLAPDRLPIQVGYDAVPARQALVGQARHAPSIREIVAAIVAEPVEDGMTHPAERLIATFAQRHGSGEVRGIVCELEKRRLAADFLRLLGRAAPLDAAARSEILRDALQSSDLEVRDAAIQAAESWNDRALAEILRSHREQVPWLADYLRRVAADLEG